MMLGNPSYRQWARERPVFDEDSLTAFAADGGKLCGRIRTDNRRG